jgi:hypothetical protein
MRSAEQICRLVRAPRLPPTPDDWLHPSPFQKFPAGGALVSGISGSVNHSGAPRAGQCPAAGAYREPAAAARRTRHATPDVAIGDTIFISSVSRRLAPALAHPRRPPMPMGMSLTAQRGQVCSDAGLAPNECWDLPGEGFSSLTVAPTRRTSQREFQSPALPTEFGENTFSPLRRALSATCAHPRIAVLEPRCLWA